ncbi:MAG: RDD family protein [Pseudomonadales bacterium]|nr:RDD family protein [Pseudomonadales bacterium]
MIDYKRKDFAGFWNRFIALIIDVIVVSFIVFPFALFIGLISPNLILVEVPFGVFTTTTTISDSNDKNISIEKDDVLGLWTNFYQISESVDDEGEKTTSRNLIDSVTKMSIEKTTSSDIEFYVIFIYWILLEASVWQASLGKKIMGLQVVTVDGGRPNIFQCTARNLFKILSAIIMFIGFMMAGWTDKKQALHDKIPGLLIIKKSHSPSSQQDESRVGASV